MIIESILFCTFTVLNLCQADPKAQHQNSHLAFQSKGLFTLTLNSHLAFQSKGLFTLTLNSHLAFQSKGLFTLTLNSHLAFQSKGLFTLTLNSHLAFQSKGLFTLSLSVLGSVHTDSRLHSPFQSEVLQLFLLVFEFLFVF